MLQSQLVGGEVVVLRRATTNLSVSVYEFARRESTATRGRKFSRVRHWIATLVREGIAFDLLVVWRIRRGRAMTVRKILPAVVALVLLTAKLVSGQCTGDCDGSKAVAIDELLTGVAIALGAQPLAQCPPFDSTNDGTVSIEELTSAVTYALSGCPPPLLQRTYALQGTLNDQPGTGTLRFTPTDEIIPNGVRYTIDGFVFDDITGVGTAELFTLNNTFSVNIAATVAGVPVALTGNAPFVSSNPLVFGEFRVSGPGYSLRFTAIQQ